MILKSQRRTAAHLLKAGEKRVWFDEDKLQDIKEAITKADIRSLIKNRTIRARPYLSQSRGRIRKAMSQKKKGRRKGQGTRKGKKTARLSAKKQWMQKIRAQRKLIKTLKEKNILKGSTHRNIYRKAKGGFFRSRRHIKIYLQSHNLTKEQDDKSAKKEKTRKD